MLEVSARTFQGRCARWSGEGFRLDTPHMLLVSRGSSPGPRHAHIEIDEKFAPTRMISESGSLMAEIGRGLWPPLSVEPQLASTEGLAGERSSEMGEVVVLEGAFEMRRDARMFVQRLSELRGRAGPSRLIYVPGAMDLSNLALLAYMGADLFDSSLLSYLAKRGTLSLPEGTVSASNAGWLIGEPSFENVLAHNLDAAHRELGLVHHMVRMGRLRELAELRAGATPWGVAALRLFDLDGYALQESQSAVVGPRFYANTPQSMNRPDVVRWRRRVMERWRPSPHKKVLLLIPCSAKKPYFISKTHQIFREALVRVPNHEVVQELIITSPLGAVPRELELFYPAAQYDIPVTGHWGLEEQEMVKELVSSSVSKGFEHVVCHLGHGNDFVKRAVDCLDTSQGSPTSGESLRRLEDALARLCQGYERPPKGIDRAHSLASVARFQFGEGGEAVADGCTVLGSYPYSKIFHGKEQRGMLTPERGMISLTLEGASTLMKSRIHWVEMEDFDLTGNLFAVGVKGADSRIREGDEALIVRNGELVAVGIAAMNSREMVELKRGEAVKVRHKRRAGKEKS